MYKYQNKTDQDQIIPGIGFVEAGAEIDSATPIENPNFELVDEIHNQSVVGTEAPQPNAVVDAMKAPTITGEIK